MEDPVTASRTRSGAAPIRGVSFRSGVTRRVGHAERRPVRGSHGSKVAVGRKGQSAVAEAGPPDVQAPLNPEREEKAFRTPCLLCSVLPLGSCAWGWGAGRARLRPTSQPDCPCRASWGPGWHSRCRSSTVKSTLRNGGSRLRSSFRSVCLGNRNGPRSVWVGARMRTRACTDHARDPGQTPDPLPCWWLGCFCGCLYVLSVGTERDSAVPIQVLSQSRNKELR